MCHGKATIEFDCTEEEFDKQKDSCKLPWEKWSFQRKDSVDWNE